MRKKILKNKKLKEYFKMVIVSILFVVSLISYGYFINVSSTKGYFLKVEMEKLSEIKFKNDIVNLDVKKKESELFDKLTYETFSFGEKKIKTITTTTSVAIR